MMERLLGDEHLAAIVRDGICLDLPRQIEALKGYLAADDDQGAERQAHSIKGAAANIGAERLRALAMKMERAGKAGDLNRIREQIAALEFECRSLLEALAADRKEGE